MRRETFRRRPRTQRVISTGGCSFCLSKLNPHYTRIEALQVYLTDRGKIVSRGRSGLCARHQRRLAQAVKRARHLALLPYTEEI